jgi:hypothetical protein
MPPLHTKPVGVLKKTAPASFFTPKTRTSGRSTNRPDVTTLERREAMPHNPPRLIAPSPLIPTSASESPVNTIEVAQPGDADYDSDTEMEEPTPPAFANTTLTEAEKVEAVKKWITHKEKHTRKKRDKGSFVYFYMKRETLRGSLYVDKDTGFKCLQDYRWRCGLCLAEPANNWKPFDVLESRRHGVTSGMIKHLKQHGVTSEVHYARMRGYEHATGGGDHTELDNWGRKKPARLTAKEATRRWFVKSRTPFSSVETEDFQEMFLAHGNNRCAYRNRVGLRNDVYDDFFARRAYLIQELEIHCISISFTLDLWTSPNRTPIFAIVGHWFTADFDEREEVLEFVEVHGSHTGEVLAEAVLKVLNELKIKHKLFSITGDNAGNNGTLCQSLYNSLRLEFDDKLSPIGRPRMRFHGKPSWIRCLAHVVALICKDVLADVKAGSAKEAKRMLGA